MLWFQKFTAFLGPSAILYLQDWLTLPGQKQWTPESAIIFEEDNNTNACIWVGIISVPDQFQRLLVIRLFRTYQDPISQAKLQRKLIKMEIHRRISLCCQCSGGKNCLASSPNTGMSILQYCICTVPINLYWGQLEEKKSQPLQQRCRNLGIQNMFKGLSWL